MALREGLAAMRGEEKALVALCCSVSMSAHRSPSSPFLLRTVSHPFPAAVFAFPASWSADDWILAGDRGGPFGESEIDASLFPSLRSIGNDVAARVNGAFLRSFQRLLKDSRLQDEVERSGRRRGSESFRELHRSNARNFDRQESVLRQWLEKMEDETSVREIREIAATKEKQHSNHHCQFLFISSSITCKNTVGSGVEDTYGKDRASKGQPVTPWTVSVARSEIRSFPFLYVFLIPDGGFRGGRDDGGYDGFKEGRDDGHCLLFFFKKIKILPTL